MFEFSVDLGVALFLKFCLQEERKSHAAFAVTVI